MNLSQTYCIIYEQKTINSKIRMRSETKKSLEKSRINCPNSDALHKLKFHVQDVDFDFVSHIFILHPNTMLLTYLYTTNFSHKISHYLLPSFFKFHHMIHGQWTSNQQWLFDDKYAFSLKFLQWNGISNLSKIYRNTSKL